MNLFLSYASDYRSIADDLCCRLQAAGHEVFFDREDLPAGASYDDRIRQAIADCELFIFLVSPAAVADGHYTRTELKIASRKWPTPGWHVLPVMVAPTPLDTIPAYLRALTLMQPEGNLSAEVVLEVQDRVRQQTAVEPEPEAAPTVDAGRVRYRSVQLRFGRDPAGAYSLAVPESPAGAHAAAAMALDPAALEHTLWQGAGAIEGSARRAQSDTALDALLPADANARQIGQALYAALFDSPLGACLDASLRGIDPQRGDGVRIVINTTDAPELARLPWEFLYSPRHDDFLCSDRMKPVVRWLDVDAAAPTLTVTPPLRLLVAVATPTDRPELAVGAELAQLDRALAELCTTGVIETHHVDHASLERLDDALLATRPHVLHLIGHGDFVGDDGVLMLESDTEPGRSAPVSGRQLGVLLRNHLGTLRLVFLNSCMGATVSARDPFGGMAQGLIRRGLPAVIAMQFPVPDAVAVALARHFYRYLAAGQPVDAALNSARAFLYARGEAVAWGAPALHMRTPDGRLFDLSAPAAAPPAEAPPPPPPSAPTAPAPQATPPVARRGRGALIAGAIGLVLLGAGGWWLFGTAVREQVGDMSGELAGSAPPVQPAPAPVGKDTAPDSEPETPSAAPTADSPEARRAAYAEIARQLDNNEVEAALTRLQSMPTPDEFTATSVAAEDARRQLLEALMKRSETAMIAGDEARVSELAGAIATLAPDPAVRAAIRDKLPDGRAALAAAIERNPALRGLILGGEDMVTAAAGPSEPRMGYTVRRGDTLWGIARRLTGDGGNWPRLVRTHNGAIELGVARGEPIRNPDRLRVGQVLWVPLSQSTGANALDYHVQPGDSLWRIAARIYGDPQLWRHIQRHNAQRIDDPDRIHPGQVLVLPPARR
ncbi:CHAT domain-containing protein [Denitromonas iodatirespirans]|uniref:CHAT domain-containing protein n=1 Tax=Denitromonas iodatirespirans TaxID=2795389 RepID=A0A944HFF6_DENI1|nr:CHAT domain-containing protein [Denitromonas iodatirespirans]MBT0963686.1 CHAT domain-containing protein [Denitromonas iodatirespirans]